MHDTTEKSTDGAATESLSLVTPAPHEAAGNLIFTEAGLSPYYGLAAVTRGEDYGKATVGTFELAGEKWRAELKPKGSALKPRDDPSFEFETVKEFVLQTEPADADDRVAAPSVTFQVAPRWPDMESKDGYADPSTPDIEGVNARFNGSNLPLDTYPVLLRRAMASVNIDSGYFDRIHLYSNIWRFELYVRLVLEKAKAVIGSDGPLQRIFEHVSSEGSFRELREDDGKIEGYHHRVKFDSGGASALLSGHSLGKQIKHYHPKHVHADADDPLHHPKVGVCYLSKLTDGGAVKWSDRHELEREVDETLLNVVSFAGLPTRADPSVYVEDTHFSVDESERELTLIDDPLPEIKRTQEATVVEGITGNPDLNRSDMDALEAMTDGGRDMSVGALADESGVSKRTIYRVIERLNGILESRSGSVRFASDYLRDTVCGLLSDVADSIRADDEIDDSRSAWARWKARYGVEADDGARLKLRFGELPRGRDIDDILKDGKFAYPGGLRKFNLALIRYRKDGFTQVIDPLR